ncbi:MAG: hypothetical protein AMJ90_05100 [candidate division Zixibacteria bacterium SM23_73_2]|nr:MAG: hypothetical protein AMJ90_05100 [candidate division Zixibacteria bacterium SM23_73_2]
MRIVFGVVVFIFLLLSYISLGYSVILSVIFLVLALVTLILTLLDNKNHLFQLDQEKISLKGQILKKENGRILFWSQIKTINTQSFGWFELLKKTELKLNADEKITAYSFMEDYFHFLGDITKKSQKAEIDRLTTDLLAGRIEL